jgi:hypothetical protein
MHPVQPVSVARLPWLGASSNGRRGGQFCHRDAAARAARRDGRDGFAPVYRAPAGRERDRVRTSAGRRAYFVSPALEGARPRSSAALRRAPIRKPFLDLAPRSSVESDGFAPADVDLHRGSPTARTLQHSASRWRSQ